MTTKNNAYPLLIIGALYFIFGFVTWLNGTLIPFLKISCELSNFQAYWVTFAFYISYFVMALPSSLVLKQTGYRNGISLGLTVMAVGSLMFIPAAMSRTFGLFLAGLFVQGTGLAILQTAVNPYVTILGPMESAARRISIMGICNKVAGIISPLILGFVVLKNADQITSSLSTLSVTEKIAELDSLAHRVIIPYIIMALILVGLAYMVRMAHLPEIENEEEPNETTSSKTKLLQFPQLVLGFIALFGYVGVEVIAGDSIILYGQSQGIALESARLFTSYTLTSMIIGYLLGVVLIPKYISQSRALAGSALLGVLFSLGALTTSGFTSVMFIALLGLANALMWPAIWPLAISGLGKFTKTGSAVLIMGIAGGATLPLLYGKLADIWHPQQAYWILIPVYLFIGYYAIKGHKQR
jgi:glucose/galactose transporter